MNPAPKPGQGHPTMPAHGGDHDKPPAPKPDRANATASNTQNVQAHNQSAATARSGNVSGDGIGKTYTLVEGKRTFTDHSSASGSVTSMAGGANAVGHQGDNVTTGQVGQVGAAGGRGNAAAANRQAVSATNRDSATAQSGNATGDGIGKSYTLVNGVAAHSHITVSNTGSTVNRTGDASAVGQQGDNRTAGSVGQVGAAGGANGVATNRQGVAADNHDSATARSGDATGDGIRNVKTLANGVGAGSTISVANTGSASNTTGAATAVGQQGDNVTSGQVGSVGAAGGRGGAAAGNRQGVSATNRDSATARSGNATGDGIGRSQTLATGIGAGSSITVSNTGTTANRTGDASAVGQQGDNATTGQVGSVAGQGEPHYDALLHRYLRTVNPGNAQRVSAHNRDSATAQSGDATGHGIGKAQTLATGVGKGSTISVSNTGSASNDTGAANAAGQQGSNQTGGETGQADAGR